MTKQKQKQHHIIAITSALEPDLVDQISRAHPDRVTVRYRPDLLPSARYPADHDGDPTWRRTATQAAEWRELIAPATITWDFPESDGDAPLTLCPNLRWIQGTSAGVGARVRRLGLDTLPPGRLWITSASGIHAGPLAEFVFAALLYHTKEIARLQADQLARRWVRFAGGELTGQTLGIIGPGRIGREVARLARAFGMTVWAMARDNQPSRAGELGVDRVFGRAELPRMLSGVDALVLAAPHTPDTENIIDAAAFAALRPGAVLVNIGRGALVDEDALLAALGNGQIAFAALDVQRTEPLPPDSPLWGHPNVLIGPHSASTVTNENQKLIGMFLANLERFLADHPEQMTPLFDPTKGY